MKKESFENILKVKNGKCLRKRRKNSKKKIKIKKFFLSLSSFFPAGETDDEFKDIFVELI